jgi:prepilin-type N-terminal cleavage/methylation domain-containing protein
MHTKTGFTLIELLIVIAIIGILYSTVITSVQQAREKGYLAAAKSEMRSFVNALESYKNDNGGQYPDDVDRDIPSGLEPYLQSADWPNAPWPESVFDWDNWTINGNKVYQISIRFCESDKLDTCNFPEASWANNFDTYSSVYYCIAGACRAHESKPADHPGHCVNCE